MSEHDHTKHECNVRCPAWDERVYDTGYGEGQSSTLADVWSMLDDFGYDVELDGNTLGHLREILASLQPRWRPPATVRWVGQVKPPQGQPGDRWEPPTGPSLVMNDDGEWVAS